MKKPISKLKKELDKWFSLFIRLRYSDRLGMVECFTCGNIKYYKAGMQNGHFQSRSNLNTRFDEENCQAQCVACNVFKFGEQFKFATNLNNKYGEGKAVELQIKSKQIVKFTRVDYENKISYYKNAVDKLLKDKDII